MLAPRGGLSINNTFHWLQLSNMTESIVEMLR